MLLLVLNAAKLFAAQAHFICEYRMKENVMVATTDQKARMFDLSTTVADLVRDGQRNVVAVLEVLQIIKNEQDFARVLLRILEPLGVVTIPARNEPFVAREKFSRDFREDTLIVTSFFDHSFNDGFMLGVEEPSVVSTKLHHARLTRSSFDDLILAVLGNGAEATFAEIYALVERQKNGREGVLLINGLGNIFFVREADGEIRTAWVSWFGDRWYATIRSVANREKRHDENLVFFRHPIR